jgi:hypothetical protein
MSEEVNVTTEEAVETPAEATTEATEKAFVDSFLDNITDEEVKSHKMWENLKGKNADEFGRYVKELKSFTGKKGDIPKSLEEGGTQEDWDAFYGKLGRPESVEGYDWELGDEFKNVVGEQLPFYEQATEWFKETAFKAGLSNEKAEELYNGYLDMVSGQFDAVRSITAEREQENATALKNEWGDAKEGIELGIKAMLKDKGGLDGESVDELVNAGLLKDAKVAIALGKIASKFGDDPEIGHHQTQTITGLHDQLESVNYEIKQAWAKSGEMPEHLINKRLELMDKLGEDL